MSVTFHDFLLLPISLSSYSFNVGEPFSKAAESAYSAFFPFANVNLISLGHAILLAYSIRKSSKNFEKGQRIPILLAIVNTLILGVGGTTFCAILLGKVPNLLASNDIFVTYISIALLVFYVDEVYWLIDSPFIRYILLPICGICDGFGKGGAITNAGVDAVLFSDGFGRGLSKDSIVRLIVSRFVPGLIGGALAGSGGGLIADYLAISGDYWGKRKESPVAGSTPTFLLNPLLHNPGFVLSIVHAAMYQLLILFKLVVSQMQAHSTAAPKSTLGDLDWDSVSVEARATIMWLSAISSIVYLNRTLIWEYKRPAAVPVVPPESTEKKPSIKTKTHNISSNNNEIDERVISQSSSVSQLNSETPKRRRRAVGANKGI